VARSTGQRLLAFDRRLGVRYVAGADEAGRGSLAGPLVVAGVLFDYETLRGPRVRRLASLNDSKQVLPDEREVLFENVMTCASRVSVRIVSAFEIDRNGLHRSNLAGLRAVLGDLHRAADACLVDGFRLGPTAPPHRAIVDGDARSATIAAASIVAKVVRDRVMRRFDALFPKYGFVSHVGYITPAHTEAVRTFGPSALHRRSFHAACYRGHDATDAVPMSCTGRHDPGSSLAPPIRPVWALPASWPRADLRNALDEDRPAEPSGA
jgi:ribonuclease HII